MLFRSVDGKAFENYHKVAIWAHSADRVGFSLFDGSGNQASEITDGAQVQIPTAFGQLNRYDSPTIITAVASFQKLLKKYHAIASLWSGSTMAAVLITPGAATLVHVGDSRIVVERDGQEIFSTLDHVSMTSSGFNLERVFGHFGHFDKNKDAGVPSVYRLTVQKGDHFIIASRALWTIFSTEEAIDFVYYERENNINLSDIAKHLVSRAQDLGCNETLSAIIIEIQ